MEIKTATATDLLKQLRDFRVLLLHRLPLLLEALADLTEHLQLPNLHPVNKRTSGTRTPLTPPLAVGTNSDHFTPTPAATATREENTHTPLVYLGFPEDALALLLLTLRLHVVLLLQLRDF